MPTPHSKPLTRCPVYLHPAAASSPATIARIQRRTGLRVMVGSHRQSATLHPWASDSRPSGGDAA